MRIPARFLAVVPLLVAALLIACDEEEPPALEGRTWLLTAIETSGTQQPALTGTEITATFDAAKGQVTGSAGCNNYFGGYKRQGNALSFPPAMGATRKFCGEPEGMMRQEQDYLTALGAAQGYTIKGDSLRITGPGKALVFKLK